MKLYATTTSERATSGQGGNQFLKIEMQIENIEKKRQYAGSIFLNVKKDGMITIDHHSPEGFCTPLSVFNRKTLENNGIPKK